MDWLDAHGHGDLVRNSVAVINCVHRSAGGVDLDRVAAHFAARCRAVVQIPFDAHLEEGAEVELDRLEPPTRLALLELAAAVADAFDGAPRPADVARLRLGRTGGRRDAGPSRRAAAGTPGRRPGR